MEKTTKFGRWELVFVMVNTLVAKLFLVYPSSFSRLGASASILLAVYVAALGLGVFWITQLLYKKFDGMDLIAIVHRYCNRFWAAVVSIFIIILFLNVTSLFLRALAESVKASVLPKSPLLYILLFFLVGMCVATAVGIKSIIRMHTIVVPVTLGAALLLYLGNAGNFNFNNLFPIFGRGGMMFGWGALLVSFFADMLTLLLIIPYAKRGVSFSRIGWPAVLIASAMLVLTVGSYVLSVPFQADESYYLPMFRLAQYIQYANAMSRVEAIFSLIWFATFFLYASLQLYLICMLFGRMAHASSIRPAVIPFAFLLFVLALFPQHTQDMVEQLNIQLYPRLAIGIVLPIAMLAIARLRSRKEGLK